MRIFREFPVAQQVKDPAWSLKCLGSDHWPRNFHMLQMWTPPQKKRYYSAPKMEITPKSPSTVTARDAT